MDLGVDLNTVIFFVLTSTSLILVVLSIPAHMFYPTISLAQQRRPPTMPLLAPQSHVSIDQPCQLRPRLLPCLARTQANPTHIDVVAVASPSWCRGRSCCLGFFSQLNHALPREDEFFLCIDNFICNVVSYLVAYIAC